MNLGDIVINNSEGFIGFIVDIEKGIARVRGFHGSSFKFYIPDLKILHSNVLKKSFIKKQIREVSDVLGDIK